MKWTTEKEMRAEAERQCRIAEDYYHLNAIPGISWSTRAQIYDRALNAEEIKAVMEEKKFDHTDKLIAEREETHGAISDTAQLAQRLRDLFRGAPSWSDMTAIQRESLDGIATKLARMLCGDPDFPDHIDDVLGYASLYKSSLS